MDNMDKKQSILEWIQNNVTGTLDADKIGYNTLLLEEGVMDSLGIVNLVAWIEETYGFDVSEDDFEIENFRSVDVIDEYITRTQE